MEFYIHGTPQGLKCGGSNQNKAYIDSFYNRSIQYKDDVVMRICIYNQCSFYTYLRPNNIIGKDGRPESFFALTVSFPGEYCSNVYELYKILDNVYNKICLKGILTPQGKSAIYSLSDFNEFNINGVNGVDFINNFIQKGIQDQLSNSIKPLDAPDTYEKAPLAVSLMEVDSPLFFENFKKNSLIISPSMQPKGLAYDALHSKYTELERQRAGLATDKQKLETEVKELNGKNTRLEADIHETAKKTEKKFNKIIHKLEQDIQTVQKERDSYKKKLSDTTASIEQINKPIQQLARHLAGQFPEEGKKKGSANDLIPKEVACPNKPTPRKKWINTLLLACILIVCLFTLFATLSNIEAHAKAEHKYIEVRTPDPDINVITNSEIEEEFGEDIQQVDWDHYRIDIVHGGKNLDPNKEYSLRILPDDNIPDGEWEVMIDDRVINDSNKFKIESTSEKNKTVIISYKVNGFNVITRECNIK